MPSFLPDTNVLVAAALATHTHHRRAIRELQMRLNKGEDMILAAHSLVECYSTLTRMPPPNRFSPHGAWAVIQSDFIARAQAVAGLDSTEILRLLAEAPARGVSGGRTYDLLIAATAERAGADLLLTFNIRHFADLAIVVQEPG